MRRPRERTRPAAAHLLDDFAPSVDGAVVDHVHDGHAQVAADAEGDAEAQAAHDGDDVAARQAEAGAVAQWSLFLGHLQGLPILRQLDGLPRVLLLLQHPARQSGGKARTRRVRHLRRRPIPVPGACQGWGSGKLPRTTPSGARTPPGLWTSLAPQPPAIPPPCRSISSTLIAPGPGQWHPTRISSGSIPQRLD